MATTILSSISSWIISVIVALNYGGVVLLMAIQSANIPIPSEVIMPFAGYLVSQGTMNLWWVVASGTIGSLIGSIFSYYLGVWGGRPLVEKFGKYILISHHDLDIAENWFKKYGEAAVFFGRFIPIIRTFISFPAGIAEMNFNRFVIYSFLGSIPWTLFLVFIGMKLGNNWSNLHSYFQKFDWLILIIIIAGICWWIARHVKNSRKGI